MYDFFVRLARGAAAAVAHPVAFILAAVSVCLWAALGPMFGYSEAWQLVINTGTTILTFLMVFLLQNTQNREARAMQIKLDELLRAVKGARTELVDLENVTEAELSRYCNEFKVLHLRYAKVLSKRREKIEGNADRAELAAEAVRAKRKKSPGSTNGH